MKDKCETEERLAEDVENLRHRIADLEASEAKLKKAEKEWQRDEARFRALIENSSDIITVLDRNGSFLYESPSVVRLLGHHPGELLGRHALEFVHPDDAAKAGQVLESLIQNPEASQSVEFRFRHKDGSWLVFEGIGKCLIDDTGAAQIIVNSRNITERKQAEGNFKQSADRLRAVFECLTECVSVWDRNYDCLYANRAAMDHVGTLREQVVGKNMRDLLEHMPDFMKLWISRIDQVLTAGQAIQLEDTLPVGDRKSHIEATLSPIVNEDGQIFAVAVVYRDTSDRRQAQEALRESEERFRRLSEAAFEGILLHEDARILEANQVLAAMARCEVSELIGMDGLELIAPESRDLLLKNVRSGYDRPYEVVFLRRDGTTFPAQLLGKTTIYHGRTVRVAAVRDITERKQAEEALRRMSISRDLVGQMIHTLMALGGLSENVMFRAGQQLAAQMKTDSVSSALEAYAAMGLGTLTLVETDDVRRRWTFTGDQLVESVTRGDRPTGNQARGFLTGLVSQLLGDVHIASAEVACQSMGDELCRFVVQAVE